MQRFTIDKFLSSVGYDHCTHQTIVFGPKEYGGYRRRHLYTEMMGAKINIKKEYRGSII
jgi:hypothetical protein